MVFLAELTESGGFMLINVYLYWLKCIFFESSHFPTVPLRGQPRHDHDDREEARSSSFSVLVANILCGCACPRAFVIGSITKEKKETQHHPPAARIVSNPTTTTISSI
jgi:hypothetical protein